MQWLPRLRFSPIFAIPSFVLLGVSLSLFSSVFAAPVIITHGILWLVIAVGSWQLLSDTWQSIRRGSFALDYIALLAISTGIVTQNYLVAAVIVLMMSGGNALENYAQARAKRSLTALANRIPHSVEVLVDGKQTSTPIEEVGLGSEVLIRKSEVVPIDGELLSQSGTFDESSLTGEAFPVTKVRGDLIHSGTINIDQAITLKTTVLDAQSTYRKIIRLVEAAQTDKAPFVQLADQLSGWFTVVTLIIATSAYWLSGDLNRLLAVLVIATPCPLILATPIALIGGMNAAAQERIIFRRLASLEVLAKVRAIIFDKTGTITLGIPQLKEIAVSHGDKDRVLAIAAGLERNSLHPFAKAIVNAARHQKIPPAPVTAIQEKVGVGLSGEYRGDRYWLKKGARSNDSQVVLTKGQTILATFTFEDELKSSSLKVLSQLLRHGLKILIFTGDSLERAQVVLSQLPKTIEIKADCSPEDKRLGIANLKKQNYLTAMVGDGINDAPALALADVGMVFSHQEQTAATEAADVVLIGGNFSGVLTSLRIARRTMLIAKQSMYLGLGLSLLGMLLASVGYLPPLLGALTQEVIDVAVILNALRAAFKPKS